MKTFLDDLKKELKKRHFSKTDIEEILDDHKEMIESAQQEGLSDDQLKTKFGDPAKLADDLLSSKPTTIHKGGVSVEGYELLNTFPVLDKEFNVQIHLVSEDVKYQLHDLDQIEVHGRRVKDIDDYDIAFDGKQFVLKREAKSMSFRLSGKSPKFIIKVPSGVQSELFDVKLVSGDAKAEGVATTSFDLNTTSGDVTLQDVSAKEAKFRTVSGDLKLSNGQLGSLHLNMVSGDCELEDTVISGDLNCHTVSGDLEAKRSEAGDFTLHTVSGDCDGKEFYPKTITLRSVSGDVEIKNTDKMRDIQVLKKKALSGTVKIK